MIIIHAGPDRELVGGVASVLRTLASSSLAEKYDVRLVATVDGSASPRSWTFARSTLLFLQGLKAGAAVAHLHTASNGSFWRKLVLSQFARHYRIPYVVHVHGGRFPAFATSGSRARRWAVATFLANAAAVLVLGEDARAALESVSPASRPIVVANPVVVRACVSDEQRGEQVLFVGRLVADKGVFDLIDAIARLQRAGCEWRWVFVGSIENRRAEQEAMALPRPDLVDFAGEVPPTDIARYLDTSRIFCLPSYVEGLPVALLEAMSSGVACVVSRAGGIPDVIEDGVTGVLVEAGDVDALAAALEKLIRDDGLRCRISRAARESVSTRFGVDLLVARLSEIYEDLAVGLSEPEGR